MNKISKNNTPKILNAIHTSSKATILSGGTPLFLIGEYLPKIGNRKLFNPKNFEYPVHTRGLLELREKITQGLTQEFKKPVNSDQILITSGSTAGLYASLRTLLRKGDDEIILFSPHWSLYPKQIKSIGAKAVEVLLDEKRGWDINFDKLKKVINRKTKGILLTNPTSPMGSVIPRESIERLLALVESNNLVLIADETYRNIIHQNIKFTSPLACERTSSRVVLLRSFSKDFSISGLRLGYVYHSSERIDKINAVHLTTNLSASVLSQSIALELFQYREQLQKKIKKEYSKRYKIVASFLDQWSSVFSYVPPTTGFFVFPKYNLKLSSIDVFKILLNKYQVAIRPGSEFGKGGENHIRISFPYPIKHIHNGLQKIAKFLDKYKK